MQVLDYIIIAIVAIGLIIGLIKGLIKQLLSLLGVVSVTVGTAYLFQFPKQWLSGVIPDETWLSVAAIAITLIVLSATYALLAYFINKAFKSVKIIKVIDRIFGMIVGIVIAYALVAIIIALFTETSSDFMPHIHPFFTEQINNSVIVKAVYSNNVFGKWIMDIIKQGITGLLPS